MINKKQNKKFPFVGKLCQNIILLLGKKEFIDDILNLRKKWQITVTARKDDENYLLIRDDNSKDLSIEEFCLFVLNGKLPVIENKKDNKLLNKAFEVLLPKKENNAHMPLSTILKNNIPEFDNDIAKLRITYGLSEAHQMYLKSFVVYNYIIVYSYLLPHPVKLNYDKNKNSESSFNLKIYPETTLKDIQNCWPDIKKNRNAILGYDPEKQSKKKNLERDLHICLLKNSGLKCKEIVEIINKENSWPSITYQEVSRIVKRYGKNKILVKNNKPSKET